MLQPETLECIEDNVRAIKTHVGNTQELLKAAEPLFHVSIILFLILFGRHANKLDLADTRA